MLKFIKTKMTNKDFRKVIPNSYELSCRNNCARDSLMVSLNCDESSFMRTFTPRDISLIAENKVNERGQFIDFCNINSDFTGIFYPQIRKDLVLSAEQLKAFDFIQEIKESNIRIILQRGFKVDFEDFKERLISFSNGHPKTRNIPVLRIDAKTEKDLILLNQELEFIRDNFKECIVIYCSNIAYKTSWELVSSRLSGINWYVFELPVGDDNGFSLIAYCFSIGAKATSHRRYSFGRKAVSRFLNTDFSLTAINQADKGFDVYAGKDRKSYIKEDGRKSFVYPFSRWDRIVQANKLCQEVLRDQELSRVISFQKAYRYFRQ